MDLWSGVMNTGSARTGRACVWRDGTGSTARRRAVPTRARDTASAASTQTVCGSVAAPTAGTGVTAVSCLSRTVTTVETTTKVIFTNKQTTTSAQILSIIYEFNKQTLTNLLILNYQIKGFCVKICQYASQISNKALENTKRYKSPITVVLSCGVM